MTRNHNLVIVKNKEDGSVLSIHDISEASDFMAKEYIG